MTLPFCYKEHPVEKPKHTLSDLKKGDTFASSRDLDKLGTGCIGLMLSENKYVVLYADEDSCCGNTVEMPASMAVYHVNEFKIV